MTHPALVSLFLLTTTACNFSPRSADPDGATSLGTPDASTPPLVDSTIDARILPAVAPVALGTAGTYAILAKSGISGIIGAATGDLGVSPAAQTYITGFSLVADPSNTYATSTQVTGRVYAASDVAPTPAHLTTAVADMEAASADAASRTPEVSELAGGVIGGVTFPPGCYAWSTGVAIDADITLVGGPDEVWIFQIAQTLAMSADTHIVLTGGALASHVFWQDTTAVTLAANAHLEGIVLATTSVTLTAGASVHGRVLAQTAVDIDGSTVVAPAP